MISVVVLFVPVCILWFILGNWIHSSWTKDYPPINYLKNSQANIDPWRWRKPNGKLGIPYDADGRLGIKDKPGVSSCIFRQEGRLCELIAHLVGVFLIGFFLLSMFALLSGYFQTGTIRADFFNFFRFNFFLLGLGLLLLQIGDRVLRIDLYPDRIEIVTTYAFFLRRTTIYQRDQLLSVKGKIQPFWTMERGQIQPDYEIIIGRSLLGCFQVNKTFKLYCNPTQGSWFVGGLNHWKSLPTSYLNRPHTTDR